MKIVNLTKRDLFIIILLVASVWILASASLGYLSAGYDCIYTYAGCDDFSVMAQVKELLQERWAWSTDRLGAPFERQSLAFPAVCLKVPEYLIIKFWGIFSQSVPMVLNLSLVTIFVLCSVSAYVVLRKINVCEFLSVVGAMLFAFNPFIYSRHIFHFFLSACYLIPVAFYLCYCCYFEDDYLKFDRRFFSKRTVFIVAACIGIAVNGTAYYAFFSCFFIAMTGVLKAIKTRKWKELIPSLKLW